MFDMVDLFFYQKANLSTDNYSISILKIYNIINKKYIMYFIITRIL